MSSPNFFTYKLLCLAVFITSPVVPTVALFMNSPNAIPTQNSPYHHPTSSLASKVIYESPSMSNIYKEYLVTSKPLTLRNYLNGSKKKMKKTKKDSKIYFIAMPPMPYRFIPGVGYDYQPMKIKPIMMETATNQPYKMHNVTPTLENSKKDNNELKQQLQGSQAGTESTTTLTNTIKRKHNKNKANAVTSTIAPLKDSKIKRLNFNNLNFNGLPVRLRAAHALPKNHLTPENLLSKFYLNRPLFIN